MVAGLLALLLAPALVAAVGPETGYLEVCKTSDGGTVSGTFRFTVGAQTIAVPAGACSAPLQLPVGAITVTEEQVPGVAVTSITVAPSEREVSSSLPARSAVVNVVSGDVASPDARDLHQPVRDRDSHRLQGGRRRYRPRDKLHLRRRRAVDRRPRRRVP